MSAEHCVRFEFRISPPLTHDEPELEFMFLGRPARIRSRMNNIPLRESPRVVMSIPGFAEEEAAWAFARRLQMTAHLAALNANMGIDVGENRTTLQFSKVVLDAMEKAGGLPVRTPVRGIDIYIPGTVAFVDGEAKGSTSMSPTVLLGAMEQAFDVPVLRYSDRIGLSLKIRTEANLLTETTAQFLVAIAAVEALASEGKWTDGQRSGLATIVDLASSLEIPDDERDELVKRLETLQRVGVVASMRRLISDLGLDEIWPRWQAVYNLRSKVLHGEIHPREIATGSDEGMRLSRLIILTAVEQVDAS